MGGGRFGPPRISDPRTAYHTMVYVLGYRDEDVVAPLCLPQVWGSPSMSAFVDPQQVWGDIMFDERQQDVQEQTGVGTRRKTTRGAKYVLGQALYG